MNEVLMRLEDEDSFECDMDEPCWRGSDDVASLLEQRTQASDNSGDGESDDGHMSVEGSRSDVDGHMSVDGASGSRSDIDGRSRSTGRVEGGRGSRRGSRGRGRGRGRSRGRGRGHSAFVSGSTSSDSDGPHASRGRSRGRGSRGSHRNAGNQQDRHGERIIPTIPTFSGSPGCTRDMTDKSPVDFFQLLIPDDLLQVVVDQTNLFAQQYIGATELPRFSRVREWEKTPHNFAELKKFLAVIIIMGLVVLPQIEDAWSTKWPFATTTFSSILKRDRFSLILRFLHLNDSTHYIPKGQPGYNPLYKLRPFMDPLIDNFKSAYNLGREIAIDESMIGFKGRLHFIQYMPKKPTKWGIKAFVLADSSSGYTHAWRLYTGIIIILSIMYKYT